MKVLFISGCAPSKFNHGEPNAYPFYIIKEIAARHETGVLYFNNNEKLDNSAIDEELANEAVIYKKNIKPSKLSKLLFLAAYIPRAVILKLFIRLKITPPRFIIPLQLSVYKKYPDSSFEKYVKEFAPSQVVVFPMQLYFAIKKTTRLKIPVSVLCTDSTVLHYSRVLKSGHRVPSSLSITRQMREQSKKLESLYENIPANYLFVGKEDMTSFSRNSGQADNSSFVLHHLYSYTTSKPEWNSDAPLNVLFAGGGHTIYTGDEPDRIAQHIADTKKPATADIHFHFLGNGYSVPIATLRQAGYNVSHETWVPDYDDYLMKMHVQVFPIIVGTGTKAKVLSAMASGLLAVGTPYTFENIEAEKGRDYIQYDEPAEVPALLTTICQNKKHYESIADAGKRKILDKHDTVKVVSHILSISVNKV